MKYSSMNPNQNTFRRKSGFFAVNSNQFRYTMAYVGLFAGIGLIGLAIVVDIFVRDKRIGLATIHDLYYENPVHWIILTAPFFLSVLFYSMGKMISEREQHIEERLQREKDQFTLLEHFIEDLEYERYNVSVSEAFENLTVARHLEHFRDKLYANKIAEEKRAWENQGLAVLGDLLRKVNDTDALAREVMGFVVKYLHCNQGSLFLLQENSDEVLDLKACYAYNKTKYLSRSIAIGQGLVGQCFLEQETMLLFDVPPDYIHITSGLGTANPTCIAIVPLKYKEAVVGVAEVASFTKLEQYQVKFLEKCAEAFAAVIQTTRVNQNVRQLLAESQHQTEQLQSQEEEMRQNMEELKAMQEQITVQLEENISVKHELQIREQVLGITTILSESDSHGTITFVNEKFCEVSQYKPTELLGKPHSIVRHPDMPKEIFKLMWHTIRQGRTFRGIIKNRKKDGSAYWVDATIVPVMENGTIVKYIGARYHIKDEALAVKLYEEQMERLGILETTAGLEL
ncbi:MAG TPA: PAS domain-containing protein [Ohtaekwangia sp.]|uniref:PAS domain-containing protein n=1 Tax=Ohtaekwangia sp. TaxID=2066019 RepID=UPI002F942138